MNGLTGTQTVRILLELQGWGATGAAKIDAVKVSLDGVAASQVRLGRATATANRRTFAQQQLLFTGRRLLFYTTLGILGLGAAVGALGFKYLSTAQQIRVAIGPALKGTSENIESITQQLFRLAAFTPFTFQQVSKVFRMTYIGMKGLGVTASWTINMISHVMDLLVVGGTATEASLMKVANALQDMGYQGFITRRMMQRLALVGIPIQDVLQKELGLTTDQLTNLTKQGISAKTVLEAIARYSTKSPVFNMGALRFQTKTFVGAWTTFIDLLSQAAGGAEQGPFNKMQKVLQGVSLEMAKFYKAGKPVTITTIVEAFDKQLTPGTHIIINLFDILNNMIRTLFQGLGMLALALSWAARALRVMLYPVTWVVDKLRDALGPLAFLTTGLNVLTGTSSKGANMMKLLGKALGALIILWGISKVRIMADTAATELNIIAKFAQKTVIKGLAIVEGAYNVVKAIALGLTNAQTVAEWRLVAATYAVAIAMRAAAIAEAFFAAVTAGSVIAIGSLVVLALLLVGGLVVLYFKWKKFHDIVNKTYDFIRRNWGWVQWLMPMEKAIVDGYNIVKRFYDLIKALYNLVRHPLKIKVHLPTLEGAAKGTLNRLLNPAGQIPIVGKHLNFLNPMSWFANGGTMGARGLAVVGERGPEILSLPTGATVSPITGAGPGGVTDLRWPPTINLRGRVIVNGHDLGELVASNRLDVDARR